MVLGLGATSAYDSHEVRAGCLQIVTLLTEKGTLLHRHHTSYPFPRATSRPPSSPLRFDHLERSLSRGRRTSILR